MLLRHRNKHTYEEGRSQVVPLRCLPVAVCLCFYVSAMKKMNPGNSVLEWVSVRKRCLSVRGEKSAVSPERMPLMGKQAGTKERTHQVSPVGQQDLFPLLFFFWVGGRRGVGEGVVFGSSPLSHFHPGRDWETLKSPKPPVYKHTRKLVCSTSDA